MYVMERTLCHYFVANGHAAKPGDITSPVSGTAFLPTVPFTHHKHPNTLVELRLFSGR